MPLLQILSLALIQSITEFLPISSSAHLFLLPWLFGWSDQGLTFDAGIHFGTLLAVVIYFRTTFKRMIISVVDPKKRRNDFDLLKNILIATFPALVVAFFFRNYFAGSFFRNPIFIGINLIFWGIMLWVSDRKTKDTKTNEAPISLQHALFIGMAQGLALMPGVSRSGITITAALFLGIKRKQAAEFSFLLSTPIVLVASFMSFVEIASQQTPDAEINTLLLAIVVTCLFSYGVIKYFLTYLQKGSFLPFVIYRVILGVAILLIAFQMHLSPVS
ncbi:MAG TPA: undecaprenyl-diphosphate phosphatase [Patescibacteria group bacterium]|nr:undecaprenyl-diphosphate phosphatase [Patescibacteria group bacterium]